MSLKQGNDGQVQKVYKTYSYDSAVLETIRLNKTPCDVIFRIGNRSIKAHKAVVKNFSKYFMKMFTQEFSEKNKSEIDLEGVDGGATASIITLAYTGELLVDTYNALSLYVTADYFQLEDVKLFCQDFLTKQPTHVEKENVFGVLQIGALFKLTNVIESADKFISKHFVDLTSVASEKFLALEKDTLVRLFSRNDLSIQTELEVFEVIKAWINHDYGKRSTHVYELLRQVRLVNIKLDALSDISEFPPCGSSAECVKRIADARKYKREPSKRGEIVVGETTRRCFSEGKIVIFGGKADVDKRSKQIETFLGGNFCQATNMKFARDKHGAAVLNGNVYITGGCSDGGGRLESCEVYSLSDNKSTLTTPMTFKRDDHGCCTHKGQLYVCGGYTDESGRASSGCEMLDISEEKWFSKSNMNAPRSHFVAVSSGDFIWAFGGLHDNSTEFYDEKKDVWTMTTPMIEERHSHSAVAFRHNIYVLGGWNGFYLNTAEIFDTLTHQFSSMQSMEIPRMDFAATVNGNYIYCLGGFYPNGYADSVESFNMITGEWKNEENLPQRKQNLAAVTVYDD